MSKTLQEGQIIEALKKDYGVGCRVFLRNDKTNGSVVADIMDGESYFVSFANVLKYLVVEDISFNNVQKMATVKQEQLEAAANAFLVSEGHSPNDLTKYDWSNNGIQVSWES